MKVKDLTVAGVVVALYLALTTMNPLGYGPIQFRISEILLMLPFWNRKYRIACLVAVGMANFFSPLGLIDVIVGLSISGITYYGLMNLTKSKWLLSVGYSVLCGIFVGLELSLVYQMPYIITALSIFASQIIITFIGVALLNGFSRKGLI